MKRFLRPLVLATAALLMLPAQRARAQDIRSPDGRVVITFDIRDFDGLKACPVYSVSFKGQPVIAPSRLGLAIQGAPLREHLQLLKQTPGSHDERWKPPYGERAEYRDHYNELVVELKESAAPGRLLNLTLRAYDEGAAFNYALPAQPGLDQVVITAEETEFRLAADNNVWTSATAQGIHTRAPISALATRPATAASPARTPPRVSDGRTDPGFERPLTIEVSPDTCAAIAEARQIRYPRMKLLPMAAGSRGLISTLAEPAVQSLPMTSPWRVVMLADSPARLLEHDYLLLNLNDPCAIADTSWIKPGKAIRETTLSTRGAKSLIDFASKHSIQFIEFDAGWYGPEAQQSSDARKVAVSPDRSQGGLDLTDVIQYGRDRGVGVILYVNRIALRRDLDDLLPLYKQWGVKGIKFGFVDVGSQEATAWLYSAVQKCAAAGIMVDIHDEYRPTGWSRTYPNLLTQEGIGGDETTPANATTLSNLFTRSLAGAADNTHCYFDARVDSRMGSHAFQLAKTVCIYSPWQFLFWYDRALVTGTPAPNNVLLEVPEMEFFSALPTVWDDTQVLRGDIGEDAVIARRSAANWFVGIMNANTPRTLEVPLNFLDRDRPYIATLYTDDPKVDTRTHVRIEKFTVRSTTTLRFPCSATGGAAVRLAPATEADNAPAYPANR
ncbi:MAG TPA: glycoside hydrolase family 97 N-terminal domain-containing protein [Phycisphaerae bacterium]|nr:glycoside hydrolase family 97 N-terminal domain-containing protein [Phycisphaerae bacterium]